MKETLRLGRILGIEIGLHWSWPVVAVLIFWTLTEGVFPADVPGLSNGTYALIAAVAAVVFFASLLLHELGHAVVARRSGMQIDGITLWLFGGVARFRGMFPTPQAETRIAVAGPIVSLALAGAFGAAAAWTDFGREADGVLTWLGYINAVLAIFNLLPAQPLDGGRVLHGLLWGASGDLAAATRRAASVGEAIAFGMIGLGVLAFLAGGGAFGGVWLAFLGWFLLNAARLESRALLMRHALGSLRVGDLMSRDPICVHSDTSVGSFMDDVAWRNRFTAYPVLDVRGHAVGLLHFRDVVALPRTQWDEHQVAERMTPVDRVPIVRPDDLASDALDRIAESPINRALVLAGDRLVGILSITDLLRVTDAGAPAPPTGRGSHVDPPRSRGRTGPT